MRIVHFTSKPGDVRVRKAAIWQREQGHEVIVIDGIVQSKEEALLFECGKTREGFRRLVANMTISNGWRRAISSLKPDVVHVHELMVLWPLIAQWTDQAITNRRNGIAVDLCGVNFEPSPWPLVYDSHELETARSESQYISGESNDQRAWFERKCVGFVDAVVTVSPSIAQWFLNHYSVEPVVVHNAPYTFKREPWRQAVREDLRLSDDVTCVVYCGYLLPDRGTELLANAMQTLHKEEPGKYRLFHVGNIDTANEPTYAGLRVKGECTFLGAYGYPWPDERSDYLTMIDALSAMDVGFSGANVGFKSWEYAMPNKLFEYPWAGIPFVTNPQRDVVPLMEEYNLGKVYEAGSEISLIEAIRAAKGMKPDRKRLMEDYAFDTAQGPKLDALYERITSGR